MPPWLRIIEQHLYKEYGYSFADEKVLNDATQQWVGIVTYTALGEPVSQPCIVFGDEVRFLDKRAVALFVLWASQTRE